MHTGPCFECGIDCWTIHQCPGLGPWWKNNGWVRKDVLAAYESAKEREQRRQAAAAPVTFRQIPGANPICTLRFDELSESERAKFQRETVVSTSAMIRWSSFGW